MQPIKSSGESTRYVRRPPTPPANAEQKWRRGLFEAAISLAGSVGEVGKRLGHYAVNAPKHELGKPIDPARLSQWRNGRTPMPDWTGPALVIVIDDLAEDSLKFRDQVAITLSDREAKDARRLRETVGKLYASAETTPTAPNAGPVEQPPREGST